MINTAHTNDSIHWYIGELGTKLVAESGLVTDRFHLGKLILQCLKNDTTFINQVTHLKYNISMSQSIA